LAAARIAGVLPKMAACFALILRETFRFLRLAGLAMMRRLWVIAIQPLFFEPHGLRRAGKIRLLRRVLVAFRM
jgi:hypothetical protein